MSGRLRAKADVVMNPQALENAIALAEDSVSRGKDMAASLSGSFGSDSSGEYMTIDGVASSGEAVVGLCVAYEAGGTVPTGDTEIRFLSAFRSGVLVVIDAYAHELALYVRSGDGLRSASAVLTE